MRLSQIRSIKGFTLIELMVTVAVLAILAVMAAPSFADMVDRYRLRKAEEDIISVISNARAAAVKLDRNVSVSFGSNAQGWCLGANAADAPTGGAPVQPSVACACEAVTPTCSVDGEVLMIAPGKHPGVQLGGTTTTLVFDGNLGLLSTLNSQSLTLTSPRQSHRLRVTIRPLGQASVCAETAAIPGFSSC